MLVDLVFFLALASSVLALDSIDLKSRGAKEELGYSYTRLPLHRSIGQPVPWPKELDYLSPESQFLKIKKDSFNIAFEHSLATCVVVNKAVTRYLNSYFFDDKKLTHNQIQNQENELGHRLGDLTRLIISDAQNGFKCQHEPTGEMDESYAITIEFNPAPKAVISANSSWGILRGLETFSQLIFSIDFDGVQFGIRPVRINDEPRFKYRGYMLDTSRHYIGIDKIKSLLDAMAHNKLNVFHWHFSDDQSFPFVSSNYPQLSKLTSYRPKWIYNRKQVFDLIQYAADRGIRVMPELDSPGHTYSLRSIPNLLTTCYNESSGQPTGDYGPVDPTKPTSYRAIGSLIKELDSVFHDSLFHAGGDEVEYDCWRSNSDITNWMLKHNMTGQYHELSNVYLRRIYDILTHFNKTMVVWQEVFDNNAAMQNDTIIHVWKFLGNPPAYMEEMKRVVQAGYRAILSSCWYLNYVSYGQDWVQFYKCDPADSHYIEPSRGNQVLGGEVCMWSEFVDDTNVVSRTWPRASAAAERLWSPKEVTNVDNFLHRLEQIRCRMLFRGIQAEPVNGPGYC